MIGERSTVGINQWIFCQEKGDVCKTWYHQHCMEIPDNVIDDEDRECVLLCGHMY